MKSRKKNTITAVKAYIDNKLRKAAGMDDDERPEKTALYMRDLLPHVPVNYNTLMNYGIYSIVESEYKGFTYDRNKARWIVNLDAAIDQLDQDDAGDR